MAPLPALRLHQPCRAARSVTAVLSLWACVLVGCDGVPSEEPLPTPEALIATFGPQPDSTALTCIGELNECPPRDRLVVDALFFDTTVRRTYVVPSTRLDFSGPGLALSMRIDGRSPDSLRVGEQYTARAFYGALEGGRGRGYVYLTDAAPNRLAGVFAVDVQSQGFVPRAARVIGAFSAAPGPPLPTGQP